MNIQRYSLTEDGIERDEDGGYMLYVDGQALAAENAALRAQLAYAIDMRDGYLKAGNELCAEKDAENALLREALTKARDKIRECVTAGVLRHDLNLFLTKEWDGAPDQPPEERT